MDRHAMGIEAFKIHDLTVSLQVPPTVALAMAGFRVTKAVTAEDSSKARHFPVVAMRKCR
jgi:hypothetical protein